MYSSRIMDCVEKIRTRERQKESVRTNTCPLRESQLVKQEKAGKNVVCTSKLKTEGDREPKITVNKLICTLLAKS